MALDANFNYDDLRSQLTAARVNDPELFETIVNAPFSNPVPPALMFLGIVVFLQVDRTAGVIKRVALSKTDLAHATTVVSAKPFHEIDIPLDHYDNVIAHAIIAGEPSDTTDWKFLFDPAMTPEQARINQANAGIAYSAVYPLAARQGRGTHLQLLSVPAANWHGPARIYAAVQRASGRSTTSDR